MPSVPEGYLPLTQVVNVPLSMEQKSVVLLNICDALKCLHDSRFYMGLLLPDLLYFHPLTLDVLLDIQPFPTGVPFVNDLIGNYPLILFGKLTRSLYMTRVADFYAVGMLIRWVLAGTFEPLQCHSETVPSQLQLLSEKLITQPESFLHLDTIMNSLRDVLNLSLAAISWQPEFATEWLHPASPPISWKSQIIFRRFLRNNGNQVLGIFCEDESTRVDVIRQHINEVLELDFFVTVTCRDFPFSTLREAIDRTVYNARGYGSVSELNLRKLRRKFTGFLRLHDHGDDVVISLADWLYTFCQEVLPAFQFQNLYLVFDAAQDFDEDSLRVFRQFWLKYRKNVPEVHVIITGNAVPTSYQGNLLHHLEIGGSRKETYERVLQSQLAAMDSPSISRLADWLMNTGAHFFHIRIVLEHLIHSGYLKLMGHGWQLIETLPDTVNPEDLLIARMGQLNPSALRLLRTLACLPSPVRTRSMFLASGRDIAELYKQLVTLHHAGLIRAYHDNSVFVPVEIVQVVQQQTTPVDMKTACSEAFELQRTYRPNALPPLIALSRLAGDVRNEYVYTVKYYRGVRSALSYERKKLQLENILRLQHTLGRKNTFFWERLLCDTYHKLNRIEDAGRMAENLFLRTNEIKDKTRWHLLSMFLNNLDVRTSQENALAYLDDSRVPVRQRVRAACWLTRSDFYLPLQRDGAERLHKFYHRDVYPNAAQLSSRMFAEITINYTIVMFQYFPDREAAAMVLLDMLESALSNSPHRDMMSLLYDAYIFQSNIRISRKYTQKLLEASKRSGSTAREQVCHLNGMELSVFQGDVASYQMHRERCVLVDEIRRTDLKELFVLYQLIYACEWEQWEEFDALDKLLGHSEVQASSSVMWRVYQSYAAFRRGLSLPERSGWEEENHYTLFVDALDALQRNQVEKSIRLFQASIAANGYHLTAGWSYRELITLLMDGASPDAQQWLDNFEAYLKQYSYDVFRPDFYRLQALACMRNEEHQQAILYLRRAANGYQMIDKHEWVRRTEAEVTALIEPSYIPDNSPILRDPAGLALIADRTLFLNQSLDLLIIIQLSEHVTESLDLISTCERLTDALFEYFPVTRADITLNLYHRQATYSYTASGIVDAQDEASHETSSDLKHSFELYKQQRQSMQLDVCVQNLTETKRKHMAHFLSVIRPHLSNAIHYMEMMMDNLTGFYQRRYFLEQLKEEFDLSNQYGLDLSLIMLDIDNFRTVNDYGHPEGDKVLQELADIVRSVIRKNDIPGRYGGEEILLILPKTDGQAAVRLAEKLRSEIEEEFSPGRPYRVTVSAGVSSLRLCGATSIDELISFADDAEIQAKATGKNRVVASWVDLPVPRAMALHQI